MFVNDMRELAFRVTRQYLRIKKGEKVLIEAQGLSDLSLPEFLALECIKVGTYPVLVIRPEIILSTLIEEWQPEDLERIPIHISHLLYECDVRISVYSYPDWWRDIDEKKRAAHEKANQQLTDIALTRKIRNLNIGFPTERTARERGLKFPQLLDEFVRAVNVDYEDMSELANKLRQELEYCKEIRIESDEGTDLSLSIVDRPVFIDDGVISDEDIEKGFHYTEIPTGEVFVAPIEDSAGGKAVFSNIPGIGKLELLFRDGKVVDAKEEGCEIFYERLEHATGDKDKIAEFAVGLNPGVSGDSEKALGSIHIAIGRNSHFGGRNESSLHWDMVIPRPTIMADDNVIIKSGQILL